MTIAAQHVVQHLRALRSFERDWAKTDVWGTVIAERLVAGHRLFAAGNGGSAAQAQHLTAELVGRYIAERVPLSAIALHADSSSLTAIANDYGYRQSMARQLLAHARADDILLVLSTSGSSPNLLCAVDAGREIGLLTLALTGRAPNLLVVRSHESIAIQADSTAVIQELHLVAIHLICEAIDIAVTSRRVGPETVA